MKGLVFASVLSSSLAFSSIVPTTPYPPAPRQQYQCSAVSEYNRFFYSYVADDVRDAQDDALTRCFQYSRQCRVYQCSRV